jgi:hypothetical protein
MVLSIFGIMQENNSLLIQLKVHTMALSIFWNYAKKQFIVNSTQLN